VLRLIVVAWPEIALPALSVAATSMPRLEGVLPFGAVARSRPPRSVVGSGVNGAVGLVRIAIAPL